MFFRNLTKLICNIKKSNIITIVCEWEEGWKQEIGHQQQDVGVCEAALEVVGAGTGGVQIRARLM